MLSRIYLNTACRFASAVMQMRLFCGNIVTRSGMAHSREDLRMLREDDDMTETAAPARPRLPGVTRLGRSVAPQKLARVPGRPKLAMALVAAAVLFAIGAIVQASALWVLAAFAAFGCIVSLMPKADVELPVRDAFKDRDSLAGPYEYGLFRGW